MSEIKWAYDSETGGFSALPASPWLLPALGLLCLAPIAQRIVEEGQKDPKPAGKDFDPVLYLEYKLTYRSLVQKQFSCQGLTTEEEMQMISIMNPPWAEPGEVWTY